MMLFIVLLILGSYGTAAARGGCGCYSSIISFGASISDTGNSMISHGGKDCKACNLPYGETYFHNPTGRYSDGRIFLDFLDCGILRESLFIVGEFGGNDYNILASGNTTLNERRHTYVPKVVKAIISAITELIELGARTLLVPGMYPTGCSPLCLTKLSSTSVGYTDPTTRCIKRLNDFAEYHNEKLLEELDQIRQVHPSTTIIYVDSYNNTLDMLRSPSNYGFRSTPLVACCGGGGPYNFNSSALCGTENAKACDDPSRYIYWDQMHFTEAANRIIANGLLNVLFTNHHLKQIKCPSVKQKPTTLVPII